MPEFKSKAEYQKWRNETDAKRGSLIGPVKKDAGRILTALFIALAALVIVGLLPGWLFFLLLGMNIISIIVYAVLFIAIPVYTFIWWMKKKEAMCPYCNGRVEFSDSVVGVTCKACKKRSVIRGNRLCGIE